MAARRPLVFAGRTQTAVAAGQFNVCVAEGGPCRGLQVKANVRGERFCEGDGVNQQQMQLTATVAGFVQAA